jgi:hypothetical protein
MSFALFITLLFSSFTFATHFDYRDKEFTKERLISEMIKLQDSKEQLKYKVIIMKLVQDKRIELSKEEEAINSFSKDKITLTAYLNKIIQFRGIRKKSSVGKACNIYRCDGGLKCKYNKEEFRQIIQKKNSKAKSCKLNKDCPSGVCKGITKESPTGSCSPLKICYQGLREEAICETTFDLCLSPARCRKIDYNFMDIGECHPNNKECSSDSDCCSDSCQQGLCRPKAQCLSCIKLGEKIKRGRKCCDGFKADAAGRTCIMSTPF